MTEDDFDPWIARLQWGEQARQFREAAGIEFGEADDLLREKGFYETKLSKLENGHLGPKVSDVDAMIALYRPTAEAAEQFRELASDARRRALPGPTPSARARQYLSLERHAVEIRMVYNEIPGLLQTHEYAQALLSTSPGVVASRVYALAEERAERGRRVIHPGGAEVWVAVGEDGLRRSNGGRGTLRRQLEHLGHVAAMPNVSFRVIEQSAGNVAGLAVPFTLLHTAEGKPIAFLATATRSDYVRATSPFMNTFLDAWERAATERKSATILEERIADLTDN
ncbi:DUF5753 domain-containing protein [Actinosynnema sp. NPDC020468]|uniref:DUF5753 domain-containing protein n=1 Tax=Actinosynnema sp. NPDC020468 TaxID=3154488 RepID=UPI0033C6B968